MKKSIDPLAKQSGPVHYCAALRLIEHACGDRAGLWSYRLLNVTCEDCKKSLPYIEALKKKVLRDTAPKLLTACREYHKAVDDLFARLVALDPSFYPSKSGQPWKALVDGNAAIAEATKFDSLKPSPKRRRSAIDEAAEACGLVKVKGALGGTYYE